MSGCGRDVQAEGLELADVVADLALPVDVGVVVAGSQVAEPGFGVGEQVEDDDQDGAGDGGDGFALAAAAGQEAVALAGEGAGPVGGGGDDAAAGDRPECVASGSLNDAGEASTLSRWGRPAGDWS